MLSYEELFLIVPKQGKINRFHWLMAAAKILIVEDNRVNLKLLVMVLRPYGYELLTAMDGEEAIQIASQGLPDLILMDLQLPKMNGYMAMQRLKENPQTASIPIFALSAHPRTEQQDDTQRFGFDRYITKPIDTRSFPEEVQKFLSRAGGENDPA